MQDRDQATTPEGIALEIHKEQINGCAFAHYAAIKGETITQLAVGEMEWECASFVECVY